MVEKAVCLLGFLGGIDFVVVVYCLGVGFVSFGVVRGRGRVSIIYFFSI